jgi:hypothetical protein
MAKEATNKNVLFEFPPQDIRLFERFAELIAAALAQPEREWVGLTDEERLECEISSNNNWRKHSLLVEAKLKDKNA